MNFLQIIKNAASIEFRDKILSKFRTSEVGEICETEEMIPTVRYREWEQGNRKNRSAVMNSMRLLGHLLIQFRTVSKNDSLTSPDMLIQRNLPKLEEAIKEQVKDKDQKGL
jgi:hypothetical protein